MRGDLQPRTWVFRTADGWARRVLATTSTAASIILAEEIDKAEAYSLHAYRNGYKSGKRLDAFKLTDFVSCVVEHVET